MKSFMRLTRKLFINNIKVTDWASDKIGRLVREAASVRKTDNMNQDERSYRLTDYFLVYKRTYHLCLEVSLGAMAAYMGLLGLFDAAFSQY